MQEVETSPLGNVGANEPLFGNSKVVIQFNTLREDSKRLDCVDIVVGSTDLQRGVENAGSFKPVSRSNVKTFRRCRSE